MGPYDPNCGKVGLEYPQGADTKYMTEEESTRRSNGGGDAADSKCIGTWEDHFQ